MKRMMRRGQEQLRSSQVSTWSWVDGSGTGRHDYHSLFYTHMFIEDVGLSIVPVSTRNAGKCEVELVGGNEKTRDCVAVALQREHYGYDLASSVFDFIRQSVQVMLAEGEAIYEIAYLSKPRAKKPVAFELALVQPGTVIKGRGKFTHRIPAAIAEKQRRRAEVTFAPETVLVFTPPQPWSSILPRTMDDLARLSKDTVIPPFYSEVTGNSKLAYDSNEYQRSRILAVADATKHVGWSARGTVDESMLPHYQLSRYLRFQRFLIEMREDILGSLNEGLVCAGQALGFDAKVQVTGLPTIDDVQSASSALACGVCPFGDIIAPFLHD